MRPVIDAEATLPVVLDSLLKLGPQPDEYVFADESTYSFPAILERFPARKTVMRTRQADGSYREERYQACDAYNFKQSEPFDSSSTIVLK